MAVTRLKRKKLRNKLNSAYRKTKLKHLTMKPVVRKVAKQDTSEA